MQKSLKFLGLAVLSSTLMSTLSNESLAQSRYGNTVNAPIVKTAPHHMRVQQPLRYHPQVHAQKAKPQKKYGGLMARLRGQKNLAYQVPARPAPPGAVFQQWIEWEPDYLIQPDDQLDIVVSSAPELSRTLTVGPDGRIVMPMSQPIMAAGRSFVQVQQLLRTELSKQLRDPTVAVTPRAYAPQQIFVGGEVGQPGTYTIPGQIGAIEAIFMAGGIRPTARTSQVAVLRRAPNGGMMMRTVNIRNGLLNIREYNDNMQLKRGDIIYVPQTTLAEVGTFMQNFRNALPVDFNLSYQFGQNGGGTTVISP